MRQDLIDNEKSALAFAAKLRPILAAALADMGMVD
jgi:predicted N-formylglutamate amidohydrolase